MRIVLSLFLSRFTVGQFLPFPSRFTVGQFSPSLCITAFCSGFVGYSYPFHCWSMIPAQDTIPVSLLVDVPVMVNTRFTVGHCPALGRLIPHNPDIL